MSSEKGCGCNNSSGLLDFALGAIGGPDRLQSAAENFARNRSNDGLNCGPNFYDNIICDGCNGSGSSLACGTCYEELPVETPCNPFSGANCPGSVQQRTQAGLALKEKNCRPFCCGYRVRGGPCGDSSCGPIVLGCRDYCGNCNTKYGRFINTLEVPVCSGCPCCPCGCEKPYGVGGPCGGGCGNPGCGCGPASYGFRRFRCTNYNIGPGCGCVCGCGNHNACGCGGCCPPRCACPCGCKPACAYSKPCGYTSTRYGPCGCETLTINGGACCGPACGRGAKGAAAPVAASNAKAPAAPAAGARRRADSEGAGCVEHDFYDGCCCGCAADNCGCSTPAQKVCVGNVCGLGSAASLEAPNCDCSCACMGCPCPSPANSGCGCFACALPCCPPKPRYCGCPPNCSRGDCCGVHPLDRINNPEICGSPDDVSGYVVCNEGVYGGSCHAWKPVVCAPCTCACAYPGVPECDCGFSSTNCGSPPGHCCCYGNNNNCNYVDNAYALHRGGGYGCGGGCGGCSGGCGGGCC